MFPDTFKNVSEKDYFKKGYFGENNSIPFVDGRAGREDVSPIVSLFASTLSKSRINAFSSVLSSIIKVEATSVISP